MPLDIKEPKRSLHLVLADMIRELGGYEQVASACLVAPVTVNKWKGDPSGSGQPIPFSKLQVLLAMCGERLTNLGLQNLTDELLNEHILALCFRVAYPQERVFQVIEMLQTQVIKKVGNE